MNYLQIKQLAAGMLVIIGGYLVNSNVISAADWSTLTGALEAVGSGLILAWGIVYPLWEARHKKQLENAAKVPGVTKIDVDLDKASPGAAAAVANDNGALKKVEAA